MSESVEEFQELLARVREGSQEAAWDLIEKYSPAVLRVVRRKLPQQLRRKFDSQDFLQAAWASMFAHRSRLARFDHPRQFVAYLAVVAGNKVGVEVRRRIQGKRYNATKEQPLGGSRGPSHGAVPGQQPTPSQIAVARERWFKMVDNQPSHYQKMIELRYGGHTFKEIGEALGYDERTVRRVVRRLLREQDA